jgi:O-antigen ligase
MRNVAFGLSLLLVLVIPLENLVMGEEGGTLSRALGLGVAAFWLATVVLTGRMRRLLPFHFVVFLFVLWNALSVTWSYDVERTLARTMTYVQQLGLVLILWDLYTTPRTLTLALQAYVLGSYVSAIATVYSYLQGSAYYYERYAAAGFNPNDLGVILALAIPTAWYLATSGGSGSRGVPRLVNLGFIPLAIFAIFLTASRGALVGVAAAFVYMIGSLGQLSLRTKVWAVAGSFVALLVLLLLIPETSMGRVTNMGLDLNGRLRIWTEGFRIFEEHPLLGVGSGAFKAAIQYNKSPHNIVISLLGEVGLVGFTIFCVLLLQTALAALHQPRPQARFWLTILAVWGLGSATHQFEQRKQTWLFLGLTVVSSAIYAQREDEAASESLVPLGFERGTA